MFGSVSFVLRLRLLFGLGSVGSMVVDDELNVADFAGGAEHGEAEVVDVVASDGVFAQLVCFPFGLATLAFGPVILKLVCKFLLRRWSTGTGAEGSTA